MRVNGPRVTASFVVIAIAVCLPRVALAQAVSKLPAASPDAREITDPKSIVSFRVHK